MRTITKDQTQSTDYITTTVSFMKKRLLLSVNELNNNKLLLEGKQHDLVEEIAISSMIQQHQILLIIGRKLYKRFYDFSESLAGVILSENIDNRFNELMEEVVLYNDMRFQVKKQILPLFVQTKANTTITRLAIAS